MTQYIAKTRKVIKIGGLLRRKSHNKCIMNRPAATT
jgi:hypothetical protein